jgi:hypothetical protein
VSKSRVSKEQLGQRKAGRGTKAGIYAVERRNMYYWNVLSGAAKKQICDVEEREATGIEKWDEW